MLCRTTCETNDAERPGSAAIRRRSGKRKRRKHAVAFETDETAARPRGRADDRCRPQPRSAAADETRVVFVTHGQSGDPYWSVVKNGMDDAAKTLGVKAEYLAPETFDMAKMAQMIDAAAASKPDGLVVSIADPAALSGPVKNAVAAGIPVIVIDFGRRQADQANWAACSISARANMKPA